MNKKIMKIWDLMVIKEGFPIFQVLKDLVIFGEIKIKNRKVLKIFLEILKTFLDLEIIKKNKIDHYEVKIL